MARPIAPLRLLVLLQDVGSIFGTGPFVPEEAGGPSGLGTAPAFAFVPGHRPPTALGAGPQIPRLGVAQAEEGATEALPVLVP